MKTLDQALRDLGCVDLCLASGVVCPPPVQTEEQASGLFTAVTLGLLSGWLQAGDPELRRVEVEELQGLELALYSAGAAHDGLVLCGEEDLMMEREHRVQSSRVEGDGGAALLLVPEVGGCCLVTAGGGERVLLARGESGELSVGIVSGPEVPSWMLEDGEPWVQELMSQAVDRGPLGPSLAAGHRLRFHEPPKEDLADLLDQVLAGGTEPHVETLRAWASALPAEQREALDHRAAGLAARTLDDLFALEDDLQPEDPGWLAGLAELLEARDDLASLHVLLDLVDAAVRLPAALGPLDARLRLFLRALPVPVRVESERLMRAGARSPASWWTGPAGLP